MQCRSWIHTMLKMEPVHLSTVLLPAVMTVLL